MIAVISNRLSLKTVLKRDKVKNPIAAPIPTPPKATFIKSIATNLILSQTIGLSSAEELTITPFNLIDTYLHIPDVKGSTSLFETEMLRSKEYINRIKEAEGKSFVIMDELFSSTNLGHFLLPSRCQMSNYCCLV